MHRCYTSWKRWSVGAPSRNVPSLSVFLTKSPNFRSVCQTVLPWERWITDGQKDVTDFIPSTADAEGNNMKQHKCQREPMKVLFWPVSCDIGPFLFDMRDLRQNLFDTDIPTHTQNSKLLFSCWQRGNCHQLQGFRCGEIKLFGTGLKFECWASSKFYPHCRIEKIVSHDGISPLMGPIKVNRIQPTFGPACLYGFHSLVAPYGAKFRPPCAGGHHLNMGPLGPGIQQYVATGDF